MKIVDIIEAKKNKKELSKAEIEYVIRNYHNGKISDKRMLEFIELINENTFTYKETYYMAYAMAMTGDTLNLSNDLGVIVDKHSAGAVSDAVTLVGMAVLSSLGVKTVKVLSERFGGFSHSLERFKLFHGFDAKINTEELKKNINNIGCGLLEETGQIAPVDIKLYNLRKQAKIRTIPLVASSILSKKIATGANTVVFDVKCGEGGIFNSYEQSIRLAEYLVESAKLANINVASIVSNLNQPLGSSFGPRMEVEEAISVLNRDRTLYDAKLLQVAKELVAISLMLAGVTNKKTRAFEMFDEAIETGIALAKFKEIISTYGGLYDNFINANLNLLDGIAVSYITSDQSGIITDILLKNITQSYKIISNNQKGKVDKNAGFVVLVREGDKILKNQKIIRVCYSIDNENYSKCYSLLKTCVVAGRIKPKAVQPLYKIIL